MVSGRFGALEWESLLCVSEGGHRVGQRPHRAGCGARGSVERGCVPSWRPGPSLTVPGCSAGRRGRSKRPAWAELPLPVWGCLRHRRGSERAAPVGDVPSPGRGLDSVPFKVSSQAERPTRCSAAKSCKVMGEREGTASEEANGCAVRGSSEAFCKWVLGILSQRRRSLQLAAGG